MNLEFLAKCVVLREDADGPVALPDTLVGTDSHTTMINGLGVVGWGVGGIEAEAVMLGQPLYMLAARGGRLRAARPACARAPPPPIWCSPSRRSSASEGVVDKFVEFFGAGVSSHDAGRPRDDGQHGARVRRHDGLLPDRRADARLPARDRPHRRPRSSWSSATPRSSGLFRTDRQPRCRSYTDKLDARSGARSSRAWPGPSGRRTACRSRDMKRAVPQALRAAGERSAASASHESELGRHRARGMATAAAPRSATAPS